MPSPRLRRDNKAHRVKQRPFAAGAPGCLVRYTQPQLAALALSAVTVIATPGCTGLDPIQPASDGTWYVGSHTGWGSHGETSDKSKAIKAASDFCLARGQHMVMLDAHAKNDLAMSSASVHFKCETLTE